MTGVARQLIMIYRRKIIFLISLLAFYPAVYPEMTRIDAIGIKLGIKRVNFQTGTTRPRVEPSFDFPLGFLRRLMATQTRTPDTLVAPK